MMAQQPKRKPEAGRQVEANFSSMAAKLGVTAAAWPSGMVQLTQAYAACRRCVAQEACADFLERTPDSIQLPPEFCQNAAEFARLNKTKPHG